MNPAVYTAAMMGKMENLVDRMDQERTPYDNTVLHIAAQYGQSEFVQELLAKMDSSKLLLLLPAVNQKGALHVASREGHSLIIRALLKQSKELDMEEPENGLNIVKEILTSVNDHGDTALHEALRTSMVEKPTLHKEDGVGATPVVPREQRMIMRGSTLKRILTGEREMEYYQMEAIKDTPLDDVRCLVFPNFAYPANAAGETPLYLAAESECLQMVSKIADNVTCDEANAAGPGGRTALHAAVISNNEGNTAFLLEWNKNLARKADRQGWTPLHYAAECGHIERVRQLLGFDGSLGYQVTGEEDGKNTALHIAARQGHVAVLKELVSECAGCWDVVNAKGQNMLHVAVESKKPQVINFSQQSGFFGSLLNQKDRDGNTPLHLAARDCRVLRYFSKIDYSTLHKSSYNNENQSAVDILAEYGRGYAKQKKSMMKRLIQAGIPQVSRNATTTIFGKEKKGSDIALVMKEAITEVYSGGGQGHPSNESEKAGGGGGGRRRDQASLWSTQMLVASLVATATFAAGISMPGGYNGHEGSDPGSALLLRNAAFQAFVVTDGLAMISATGAMLSFLGSSIAAKHDVYSAWSDLCIGQNFTVISVILTIWAFFAGSVAVLAPQPTLVFTNCVINCIFSVVSCRVIRHYD